MSHRQSGYNRIKDDAYNTPSWATDCVVEYINVNRTLWEPAAGIGQMVGALSKNGFKVHSSCITQGRDFLQETKLPHKRVTAIVTNPPYLLARQFIEHSLSLIRSAHPRGGTVAMLLRSGYDHAVTRRHLFAECPDFWCKVVLTKRIRWIEDSVGSPSDNHAWYIWITGNTEAPCIFYEPRPE